MNMFRCVLASGTGSGGTIMVTCDAAFAGLTISCSDGTETYTQTCPSSFPYTVAFEKLYPETWTISGTISGTTYTATKEIPSDFPVNLTAGFDWCAWVDESVDLDSSDYADLDELLANEEAVRELFLVHDCVDYMASVVSVNTDLETIINNDICAKWINLCDYALDTLYANSAIATAMDTADKYFYGEWVITDDTTTPPTWGPKGNVPVMTSNTAPYGTAIADAQYTGSSAYYALNRDLTTSSSSNSSSTSSGSYVGYKFTNPVSVRRVTHYAGAVSTAKIQYSDDGSTWTDAGASYTTVVDTYVTTDIDDCGYHLYWRTYKVSSSTANRFGTRFLQFYGRELKVSVPVMTSNTAPYGTASATSVYSSDYPAWKAFDSDITATSDRWAAKEGDTNNYLIYEFTSPVVIKKFTTWLTNTITVGKSIYLAYSDNGTNFTRASGIWTPSASGTQYWGDCTETNPHKYWAVYYELGGASKATNFYGVSYSEKEFEQGSTKKWLYDHGVEPSGALTAYANGTGATATKNADNVELVTTTAQNIIASLYNQLDLSNYNLARLKVGDTFTMEVNAPSLEFAVYSQAPNAVASGREAVSSFTAGSKNLPNNLSIDVSSFNQTKYLAVSCRNASSTSYAKDVKLIELWLE